MTEQVGTREVTVTSRVDGHQAKATLFYCVECGTVDFIVFNVHGRVGQHMHLQCAGCGASYCRGGQECDA